MARIALTNLEKRFGSFVAVESLSLDVADGEFLALLGPSGCGKTTILRMISGLTDATGGRIHFGARDVTELPPYARNIGLVFQGYALFPHMTVAENVAFGLEMRALDRGEIGRRVHSALQTVQLAGLADRLPRQLSDGQQQRVALARALAPKPDILLLDEPLSNLDANLRADMRFEIRRLHDQFQYTSIYVTHDQTEAMTMADRIVVMNAGRIEQIGTPTEVYQQPRSEFVARFIGASNVIAGLHVGDARVEVHGHVLQVGDGEFSAPGEPMSVCVKMHDLEIVREATSGANVLPGIVRKHAYLGSHRDYIVDVGQEVLITAPAELDIAPGANVGVRFPAQRCRGLTH